MKVLFFISSLTGGGAERVTVGLASYMADKKHSVSLVTMHGVERDFFSLDERINRICLNLGGKNTGLKKLVANFRRLFLLRKTIRLEKPDVVVAMMTSSTVLAIIACFGLPTKVVGSERNYPGSKSIGVTWATLRRVFYRFADAHVAQTKKGARWIKENASASNIAVIQNAVVWPIAGYKPYVDPRNTISLERRVILSVGTKCGQKGFDLLLTAFSAIAHEIPDWDLVILGLEPNQSDSICSYSKIVAQVDACGLKHRVFFPGRVGNVGDWYKDADIFVLSSRYEGFPNVLLEAMASGCACVAFDCNTGPKDIIKHEKNGLLIEPENTYVLSEAILLLANNPGLRKKMSFEAPSILCEYSEAKILNQWLILLESLAPIK
jgi:glycosyltransferase involved in cell wall biosynthesis